MVVGEKGVGSEVRRLEVKESQTLKTKDRRLGEVSRSETKVISVVSPSVKRDGHTWDGGGGYVNTGGCVVVGRPGICGPGSGGIYAIGCAVFKRKRPSIGSVLTVV